MPLVNSLQDYNHSVTLHFYTVRARMRDAGVSDWSLSFNVFGLRCKIVGNMHTRIPESESMYM